jgi:DNA-binding NtrC family response regulator
MSRKKHFAHICLTGKKVSLDWQLINGLNVRHRVTLTKPEHLLSDSSVLRTVDILVLDCNNFEMLRFDLITFLKKVKAAFPKLCTVVINGGLSQQAIAGAFREGISDYFPDPYEVKLILERLEFLIKKFGLK